MDGCWRFSRCLRCYQIRHAMDVVGANSDESPRLFPINLHPTLFTEICKRLYSCANKCTIHHEQTLPKLPFGHPLPSVLPTLTE